MMAHMERHDVPFALQPFAGEAMAHAFAGIEVALRAAGCRVLLVSYGYSEGRDVRSLDADGVVATLGEAADRLLD